MSVFMSVECWENIFTSTVPWILWFQLLLLSYSFTCCILFISPVDKNGDVCISILHEPGEDKYGYEKPEERWLPIHTVETIMISVISMLADPNGDSPANVDAAVSWPFKMHMLNNAELVDKWVDFSAALTVGAR